GCRNDMSCHVMGAKGVAEISESRIRFKTESDWRYRGEDNNIYQAEHDALFASIRQGNPINNGEYMAKSTLLAIMGRMATYTGQEISWDKAWNSKEDLTPPSYQWGPIAEPPVAVPGVTKFF